MPSIPRVRTVSAVLAAVTFFSFGVSRFAEDAVTVSPGDAPAAVLLGVLAAIVAAVALLVARGRDVRAAGVVALGPPVGLLAYLALAVAVYGPSTDSPTWLIWLAFAAACLALGGLGAGIGTLARRSGVAGS